MDLTPEAVVKLLGSYGGRDKAFKLVHYICRTTSGGLVELLNRMPKNDPKRAALQTRQKLIHSVFVHIMESRRTFRWLASLPVLLGLYRGKSAWKNKNMFIVAQVRVFAYLLACVCACVYLCSVHAHQ
jgi:hypothetical protein